MKVTMVPTEELYDYPLKGGGTVPARVWVGQTEGGVPVDVYVLSVVPGDGYAEQFKGGLPHYMLPARDVNFELPKEHRDKEGQED